MTEKLFLGLFTGPSISAFYDSDEVIDELNALSSWPPSIMLGEGEQIFT